MPAPCGPPHDARPAWVPEVAPWVTVTSPVGTSSVRLDLQVRWVTTLVGVVDFLVLLLVLATVLACGVAARAVAPPMTSRAATMGPRSQMRFTLSPDCWYEITHGAR